ncbi:MAG: DUF4139 domain-containing protein [Pseudomonadota bacterium]
MFHTRTIVPFLLLPLLIPATAWPKNDPVPTATSTIDDQESVAVTVYNSNLGLVKETRALKLPRGVSLLRFMDVAQQINPATVHVKSLTSPALLTVLEQNYEYDLLNPEKLLDKYVGREATLTLRKLENNTERLIPTRATLLANNNGQVWKIGNEVVIHPTAITDIRFDTLPDDLIARPTLVWMFENKGGEKQTVEASYLTDRIDWHADYVAVVSANDTKADLNGWVTIDNESGATYRNASLKLVAGKVNRVQPEEPQFGGMRRTLAMSDMKAAPQFAEEKFFEYHLYTLERPATLKNAEKKQISLLTAAGLNVTKELILNGQAYYFRNHQPPGEAVKQNPAVYVEFKNSKENHLGLPLPAGVVRVYKADLSNAQQFIGEDRIDHTPKDEAVRIKLGEAFDVTAERKQTDYKVVVPGHVFEQAYEIKIRNHKEEGVTVIVNEPIGGDWEILSSTFPAEKTAAFAARFKVPVGKDKQSILNYRVRVKS